MGPGENGPHVVLRWLTDITASGYGYYCIGVRILLRRDTDITASGYRYYCVGERRRIRRLIETAESAN